MRLPEESEDTSFQINIVPMIDIIFAILTFFIMSTLFLTRSEGLPVNLPKAATAETQQPAPITVTINEQGEIAINRQSVLLDNLEATIREQVGANESALVVINADASVSHGQVVAVMDRLRLVKGVKLAIATTKP
jgi:biopolymer transport protein ExbD